MTEGKNAEKFVELAEKRVQKALDALESIGKLSNRSNYSYNDEQIRKIKTVLSNRLNNVISRFTTSGPSSREFKL
jgi:hypothetical protein